MRPAGRIHWGVFAFLLGFTGLLMVVSYYALLPGMQAATQPSVSDPEKHTLVAWYRLLLMVVLFILFSGIVLTFRFGRFFVPRNAPARVKTQYVDAWAESANRVEVPPPDDDQEEDRQDARDEP